MLKLAMAWHCRCCGAGRVQIPSLIYYSDHNNVAAWWNYKADNITTPEDDYYIQQWWMTPGNLGPGNSKQPCMATR